MDINEEPQEQFEGRVRLSNLLSLIDTLLEDVEGLVERAPFAQPEYDNLAQDIEPGAEIAIANFKVTILR